MHKSGTLVTQTVASITRLINEKKPATLPSVHELSKTLKVSVWTIRAAIKILVDTKKLLCSQGKPSSVCYPSSETGQNLGISPANIHLADILEKRITEGEYWTHEPLPKTARLMLEEHVSPNTISAAIAELSKKNLVHRIGKRWIVGPQPANSLQKAPRRFKTVLLLTPRGWESRNFYSVAFLTAFSRNFVAELHEHGIMLTLAFFQKGDSERSAEEGPIPSGTNDIRAHIKSLGDDYLGTLIYFGWGIPEEAHDVVRMLMSFDKPVIDFDHGDQHRAFSDQVTSWRKGVWHRCHFDEKAAVELAINTIAEHGHTCIGVPVYSSDNYNWVLHRVDLLREAAQRVGLKITTREQKEKFWKFESNFDPGNYSADLITALEQSGMKSDASPVVKKQSLKALLLSSTPSLTELIQQDKVTALIALNDEIAREIYLWLKFTGIKVPEEISIISFDNIIEFYHMPVSTIDFGFSRLGYKAAHIFIDDIPIRSGKNGDMPGTCALINKGSIASIGG